VSRASPAALRRETFFTGTILLRMMFSRWLDRARLPPGAVS
jgi:hypothetical protein